ncbi:hypothetical protein DRQ33_00020 [bacterium]|nr:MAG: hypothetical protein DRQ33_00020 [bacterium]
MHNKFIFTLLLLLSISGFLWAEYPAGYFYAIFRGDTFCLEPVITDSVTEAEWFDYTSASMHTGFETEYETHFFFFYNPMTGNIGFVVQHNIDEFGTTDATCILYLDGLPSGCSLAMSDDSGEFDLSAYPQGNWHWWDNTDGGAFYIPRDEWQFTLRTTFGSIDPIRSMWFISGNDGSDEIYIDTVIIDQEDTILVGHGFLQLLTFVDTIGFDSLNVHSADTFLFPVCNSDETIDTLRIGSITNNHPESYTIADYPEVLAPGDCGDIMVIFHPADTGTIRDTMVINTEIPCDSSTKVPIYGRSIQPRIDSVWFWEETDCDGQNIVEICYDFYGDEESFFPIDVQFTLDTSSGMWFDFTEYTIQDYEGDIDDSVHPGEHCFQWIMSEDMPDVETADFTVQVSVEISEILTLEIPSLSTTTEYWDTITMSWVPAVEVYYSGWGSRILPGSSWIWDSVYSGAIYDRCLTFRTIIETPSDATIDSASISFYADNTATVYMNGDSVGADTDGATWTTIWTFDLAPFMHGGSDTLTIEACDLTGVAVGLDFLVNLIYESYVPDPVITTGPVDSHPPLVEIPCEWDSIFYGDTVSFDWEIDDYFPNASELCTTVVFYCDGADTFITDEPVEWTPPMVVCDSAYFAVSAADSFCNWGFDTCRFSVIASGSLTVNFPETLALPCDTIEIPIYATDIFLPVMQQFSIWFRINDDIASVVNFTPSIAPVQDSFDFGGSEDNWYIHFIWDGRIIMESDTFGYLKIALDCDLSGGDITPLYIDSVSTDIIDVYYNNGFVLIEYTPEQWLHVIRLDDPDYEKDQVSLSFGNASGASDGYDASYDIIYVTPPLSDIDAWFWLSDSGYPAYRKLSRDIRDMEPVNEWRLIINEGRDLYVHWDRRTLDEGIYLLNGYQDMRADTDYFAEPYETLTITWSMPELEVSTIDLFPGWNLVSVPVHNPSGDMTAIFPWIVVGPLGYNAETRSYYIAERIQPGAGYWVFSSEEMEIPMIGTPVENYALEVKTGWNLVGATISPVLLDEIAVLPTASIISLFKYNAISHSYDIADILQPGRGYWIFITNNGTLLVPAD